MPTKKQTLAQRVQSLERQLNNANDALEYALAVSPERDNTFFPGGLSLNYESRTNWDRKKVFAESMRAWRVNPIARRIVRLIRSFIIGKGLAITSNDEAVKKFLLTWWHDPLNNFDKNVKRWKEEDTRTGNLFFLFTVQENGDTHVRAVPAENIAEIDTAENDVEQELHYWQDEHKQNGWEAYDPSKEQKKFMLHFASNQPVGTPWGEADLSPLLVWIGRFSSWLEDRVRLNKFRTAFMYVISGAYADDNERQKREAFLNAHPPKSGSVLVLNRNNGEAWGILSAKLDAFDASMDGTAIKKMIASGIGFPMHYLAEPEDSTRTTAEAAGTPTFRTLEEEQNDFFNMLHTMAYVAIQIKNKFGKTTLKEDAKIEVSGPDITERDNATLALALGRAYPNLADLYDRDGIEPEELLRLAYKMFGEVWEGKAPDIKKKPLTKPAETAPSAGGTDETDPKSEETK